MVKAVILFDIQAPEVRKPSIVSRIEEVMRSMTPRWGEGVIMDSGKFQWICRDHFLAFDMSLFFRSEACMLRAGTDHISSVPIVQMRASIGVGQGMSQDDALESATKKAERGLKHLKKNKKISIYVDSGDRSRNEELQVELHLLQAIISHWSYASYEIIHSYLRGRRTQNDIASELDISQSSVQRRMSAMNWDALLVLMDRYKHLMHQL